MALVHVVCLDSSKNLPLCVYGGQGREQTAIVDSRAFFIFYFFEIIFIAFLGVSRHEEPRNSEKNFFTNFLVMAQKVTS